MAGDVWAAVLIRWDETEILVVGKPAGLFRLCRLVDPVWTTANVPFAAGHDAGDVAVGGYRRDGRECRESGDDEGMHLQDESAERREVGENA